MGAGVSDNHQRKARLGNLRCPTGGAILTIDRAFPPTSWGAFQLQTPNDHSGDRNSKIFAAIFLTKSSSDLKWINSAAAPKVSAHFISATPKDFALNVNPLAGFFMPFPQSEENASDKVFLMAQIVLRFSSGTPNIAAATIARHVRRSPPSVPLAAANACAPNAQKLGDPPSRDS